LRKRRVGRRRGVCGEEQGGRGMSCFRKGGQRCGFIERVSGEFLQSKSGLDRDLTGVFAV